MNKVVEIPKMLTKISVDGTHKTPSLHEELKAHTNTLELKSPKSTEDLKNLKKISWVGTPLFLFFLRPLVSRTSYSLCWLLLQFLPEKNPKK